LGQAKGFAKKWIKKDPSDPSKLIRQAGVDSIKDEAKEDLQQICEKGEIDGGSKEGEKRAKDLKGRKLLQPRCAMKVTLQYIL
jgi:hypothetical protein